MKQITKRKLFEDNSGSLHFFAWTNNGRKIYDYISEPCEASWLLRASTEAELGNYVWTYDIWPGADPDDIAAYEQILDECETSNKLIVLDDRFFEESLGVAGLDAVTLWQCCTGLDRATRFIRKCSAPTYRILDTLSRYRSCVAWPEDLPGCKEFLEAVATNLPDDLYEFRNAGRLLNLWVDIDQGPDEALEIHPSRGGHHQSIIEIMTSWGYTLISQTDTILSFR